MTLIRDMCYPTPHELALAARALADEHPALARLRQIGASRAGEPLWLLSVGDGDASRAVLVVAGAHANEPVGGATALALARRLIREATGSGDAGAGGAAPRPDAGTTPTTPTAAGTTWHFLLCADPDGAALHRTPRPYSLLDYHRNFFRPPGPEQPEWAPSLLPPDRLPPETLALTRLIDELRPALQVSLHGTDLGGSWVQLTRDIPGLAEPFGKSAAELHIPVETSASDASGWPSPGAGIFVMPEPGTTDDGPFHPEDTRLSTWYHAHRHAGTTAIVEVPMWASDLVDDPAPHPDPRAALRVLAGRLTADAARVAALRESAGGGTDPGAAALLRAVDWTLALIPRITAEWTGAGAPAEATAAYIGSIDAFGRRLSLRAAAMLLRVLRAQGQPTAPAVDRLVTGWCEEFADRFQARWVPVATQVEHQSRVVLAAYDRLVAAGR
ncbi:M14 family zinc carboxypeptidase [Streptomyces sp. NBC_00193]|uniref:M14 family zinc carboxypeptidase n=1 Tax=Streptomyces sp. NBC_00193 TaxID=2975675 RepID=UPI00224D37B2|nr:M14 family zinc carboxypeptidase [Streptomyces sp. NBC_00193]MCX5295117.1 M14 family zinc carboxypeptidase [Streptomyces sp. NBC_00193]